MRGKTFQLIRHVFLQGRGTFFFVLGIVLGLGFSMTVILATMGIMDGYEKTLKRGLRLGQGDVVLTARRGFVSKESIRKGIGKGRGDLAFLITTQGFLLYQGKGQGVQIRAVEPRSFEHVSKLFTPLVSGEILLGKDLAENWKIKKGDSVVLALGQEGDSEGSLPGLLSFKYAGSVEHGIFEADNRIIYVHLKDFQERLGLSPQEVNQALLLFKNKNLVLGPEIKVVSEQIELDLMGTMRVRPFYADFASLIEAVKIEKVTISLILQIIVAVSVFNLMALVLYLTETRAREIFLIEALGVSKKELQRLWTALLLLLWLGATLVTLPLLQIVRGLLYWLSSWALPGEVYTVSHLQLDLGWNDFAIVYGSGLLWIILLFIFVFWRLKKRSIIEHLRQEFA